MEESDDGAETPAVAAGVVARGVRRSFGSVEALRGIDLDAAPGQVTALVGPNGAGKTTLLLILATLLTPDSGRVRVAGADPVSQASVVRAHVGWSPDAFGTYDGLTAAEYLRFFAAAYRLAPTVAETRIPELLETVGMPEVADLPVGVLSRGQKQRLGLARALVNRPSVLLLDEPSAGLDPRARVQLRATLRRLAADGAAVIVSSHLLADLEETADRVVFVDRGVTVGSHTIGGPPAGGVWRLRTVAWQDDGPQVASAALERIGRRHRPPGPAGLDVELRVDDGPLEDQAAALLAELVAAGVAVTAFAPVDADLESTYLRVTEAGR